MRIRALFLGLLAVPALLPAVNAQTDYVSLTDDYVIVNADSAEVVDDALGAPYATTGTCTPFTITAWVTWPGTTVWVQTEFQCNSARSGRGDCNDSRGDTQYESCTRGTQATGWSAQTWDGSAWRNLGAGVTAYINGNTPSCDTQSYGPHPSRSTPNHGCTATDANGKSVKVQHRATIRR